MRKLIFKTRYVDPILSGRKSQTLGLNLRPVLRPDDIVEATTFWAKPPFAVLPDIVAVMSPMITRSTAVISDLHGTGHRGRHCHWHLGPAFPITISGK